MDPIADMLIRIKNAQMVRKETVSFPFSRVKSEITRILKEAGYLADFREKGRGPRKMIEVQLTYHDDVPAISGVKRISRPSQRIYTKGRASQKVGKKFGMLILSTSRGILTERDAKKLNVGGEVICEVW